MDPTLADGEILFVVKHLPIDRFDIVVAHEEEGNKDIVKRVIGMPGDTIRYEMINFTSMTKRRTNLT